MTAQISETLRFRGSDRAMCAEPLRPLLDRGHVLPLEEGGCSALWRGYVGEWEVRDDRLFLTGLLLGFGSRVPPDEGLRRAFPDAPTGGVFADWCDDWLRVPDGEELQYVHMGYASTYERDDFLGFRGGRLVYIETAENRENPRSTDFSDRFTSHVIGRELTPQVEAVYGPDEAGFLRAVFDRPDDHLPKLAYADWLEERADPRHELIRWEIGRATATSRKTRPTVAARKRVLRRVKDWLWMKVMGFQLPRDRWGGEELTW
jgi:uncharacterized protein (TIGR02996 family)